MGWKQRITRLFETYNGSTYPPISMDSKTGIPTHCLEILGRGEGFIALAAIQWSQQANSKKRRSEPKTTCRIGSQDDQPSMDKGLEYRVNSLS